MWTDDGRTTEASHTISSPGAFGSGELKRESKSKNFFFLRGGGGGGEVVDGRRDEQAQTNLPFQLLSSWGHNNA